MTAVTKLSDHRLANEITPRQDYLRAANLEAHHEQALGYIPTSRALETLRRLVRSITDEAAGRAWSLTGPYGAGKSSFALYLRALLGPAGDERASAEESLRSADEHLLDELVAARASLGADRSGFVLATGTCQQEPLAESLLRAFRQGCAEYWPKRRPAALDRAFTAANASPTARTIAKLARTIADSAPLLLILDEFGKTLEHFAATASGPVEAAADLFVLQELAEQATGSNRSAVFTFTLQHLAFDDYVRQVSAAQRREWGKVQGRFEDISFLESAEQSLRLVAGALDDSRISPAFARRRRAWATSSFDVLRDTGLANSVPGGAETLEHCYPLHPVALLALPELCGQLGQYGRTLFTFLASGEPGTARDFLSQVDVPVDGSTLPVMRLPDLFDFFAGAGLALATGVGGTRWREIHDRVREASTLDPDDIAVLKTVGLLNLMANSQGLRASADTVAFALSDSNTAPDARWRARLEDLESRGFLTFRTFADEYRLWQGSDVDLRSRVADAREQLRGTNAADLLGNLHSDTPIIAARHSQTVGMLRYFAVAYTDDGARVTPTLAASDPADGLVVYHLGSPEGASTLKSGPDRRPTVVVTSETASTVRDAAVEVASALAVLEQQDVVDDRVARRELQDRVADARNRLAQALADSFRPGANEVEFRLLTPTGLGELLPSTRGLSSILSDVCDDVFVHSPVIRNEMLGRRDLTSQGAKARRELIEAMINHAGEERLGLHGYGPERAMYEAVLRWTGLHAGSGASWGFGKPGDQGNLMQVWGTLTRLIDKSTAEAASVAEIYSQLMAPPIGLKEGPIPVFLVAFLMQRSDDVAIYEDGSFVPALTPDVIERLVKTPQRFALRSFNSAGARGRIMAAVSRATAAIDVPGATGVSASKLRNQTVLAVAAPLLRLVRALPKYTRQTSRLGEQATAVRDALLTAREPDQLVLRDLPAACGYEGDAWRNPNPETLEAFSADLALALAELRGAYEVLIYEIADWIREVFGRPLGESVDALRVHLRHRAEPLDGKLLDPKLRPFVYNIADDMDDNQTWIQSVGLALSGRPVEVWQDDDRTRFRVALRDATSAFQRVEALHFDAQAKELDGPFTARRIAITTPAGTESSRVVYYDDDTVDALGGLADDVLARADQLVGGTHGREGLVALLVERLFGGVSEAAPSIQAVPEDEKGDERHVS